MENTRIRVGNDRYAEDNGSYGLTTLLDRHAKITRESVEFRFRGKSGKWHQAKIQDRRLANIVKRCRDIPGQRLFQYVDAKGRYRPLTSTDVNDYLREITGHAFTAKMFRTWAGTVGACLYLLECEPCNSTTAGKKTVVKAVEFVAEQLGNTVAICRKCYVHPAVLEAYLCHDLRPQLSSHLARARRTKNKHGLRPEEWAVLNWLRQLAAESDLERHALKQSA
jgi:DNA topoisomerase-1